MSDAADDVSRFEIHRREKRSVRSGNDRESTATILRREKRVRRPADAPGAAYSPPRRRDRPRVDDLQRHVEEIEPFQEKRSLLGKENRETLIDGDLRDVRLD